MPNPFSDVIRRVKKVFGTSADNLSRDPHIIPRDRHNISRKHISPAALRVMGTLLAEGFQAFLVGGGVRDLLLGGHPKDFDVATDATPEQVQRLFRSARIIGRRFKIVHVRFGREVIEVTTFRASHQDEDSSQVSRTGNQQSARSENGMLLRDNVFGTVEEDAIRRDFTINALYYTTADFAVYDYTNGLQDLNSKIIRIIGDPETRYREDPVRMLRAIRFAAKLGFSIDPHTAAPIKRLAPSLGDIPAARMFDEILKLLMTGYGVATYQLMQEFGLFEPLFPQTHRCLGEPGASSLLLQALENTDQRTRQGKPVTPAFIFAALLWPALRSRQLQLIHEGLPEQPAMHQAAQEVTSRQQQSTSIPKRFSMPMREIWEMQLRLPRRAGHKAAQLMENHRFRAAYDFLLLREQTGEDTGELGKWWTDYQNRSPDQREAMTKALQERGPRRPRHNKTFKKPPAHH
jgi:poly(A) polymerase